MTPKRGEGAAAKRLAERLRKETPPVWFEHPEMFEAVVRTTYFSASEIVTVIAALCAIVEKDYDREWPPQASIPTAEGETARFGKVEGLTLAHYVLVRDLHLRELAVVETKSCAICDLNREILYYGNYEGFAECFNVCELCGKELIENSAAIIKSLASSPSALMAAVERLEREISECEDLEKDYTNRSTKELDDAWITADEVKHRIGGLKFALNLLRSPPTEAAER